MARRIKARPSLRINLPNGGVLSRENETIISDADFALISAVPSLLARIYDLGEVPNFYMPGPGGVVTPPDVDYRRVLMYSLIFAADA